MPSYYALEPSDAPWGDYGMVLRDGWGGIERTATGQTHFLMERIGPYVPRLSVLFGAVIVDDTLRKQLETSGFTGFTFLKVEIGKIVRIDWRAWDLTADEPAFYPSTGEPEDYIYEGDHDPALAAELPELYALDIAPTPGLQVHGTNALYANRHPGADIAREYFIHWVSERLKDWIETTAGEAVQFKPVVVR